MSCSTYKCVLLFILVGCVRCADKTPYQPHSDEEEDEEGEDEDNFEVLDIEQIIQQRLSRFDDPQYQPQPSQYAPQPSQYQPQYQQIQPQPSQYPGYQPETQQYQPQHYGPEFQYGPITQTQLEEQSVSYQHYGPPSYDPYQTYQTQTQPTEQEEYQYYIQPQPQQTQQLQYYGPVEQHYPLTYSDYTYGTQTTQPETQVIQQQYYQHYVPTLTQTEVTQPQPQPQETQQIQPPITQPPQPQIQSETIEDDDNFYVTEHDQVQQPQPQKKQRKRKKPITTQQIQPPSGDQSDETSLSENDEQPVKLKKPRYIKKTKHIKFYKRDNLGNLEEMTDEDYVITFNDEDKTKYIFISNLEQIKCDNEIIYEHSSGNPYSSSLTHSKRTNIIIITISEGFILIKKSSGEWERTDYKIPDYVKLFTQDSGGNEVLITEGDYDIDFTSKASFRYAMRPGVKCTKIVVNGLLAWKKTNKNDAGSPLLIYVTPKLRVIIDFEGYYKLLEIRGNRYKLSHTKKISKGSKHS